MESRINWPYGKRFAFSVFDDTDLTTLENSPRIYQFLYNLGMLTTKSVWPIKGENIPGIGGSTCADDDYLRWVRELKGQGFEIALHNAAYHTLKREQIIEGLEKFREYFGTYPKAHANHAYCEDSIYWGDERLTGKYRLFYDLVTVFKNRGVFLGSLVGRECFWGDKCKQYIKYVRNFVYPEINTLKACPCMPYFDENRPLVNYWFASSEGANCRTFCKTISEKNQDRLEEEGGACIMYTHFGTPGFYRDGDLNPEFKSLIERLSRKNGWFAPVSTILDHLLKEKGHHVISAKERSRLERKWLISKVFITRGST